MHVSYSSSHLDFIQYLLRLSLFMTAILSLFVLYCNAHFIKLFVNLCNRSNRLFLLLLLLLLLLLSFTIKLLNGIRVHRPLSTESF